MRKRVIERFKGDSGKITLVEAIRSQRLVQGNEELARDLAAQAQLTEVNAGQVLIEQGASDNDIFFILAGRFEVVVNGRKIAERGFGEHVGEMAATVPSLPRSATIKACEEGVVAKLTANDLTSLGDKYPSIWRQISKTLADRLYQRNSFVRAPHEQLRVFVISSSEALSVAYAIQELFAHDPFNITLWTNGVFRASCYAVESLIAALDASDFAIAILQGDDVTEVRGERRPVPRDNVLFELGLFIGHLGRHRSFLLEPVQQDVKLPSDLSGISTLGYYPGAESELTRLLGPSCNKLRRIFNEMGPR
jgi:CRP/FNR family transcriptional regulator, cyclic AMP receptor protein